MKKNTEFFEGFSKKELETLPVNYRLLTYYEFNSGIITSYSDVDDKVIEIATYNGKIMSSEKPSSPISKIIDFE
ncbi:hypothetical protein NQT66_13145 [Cellulophaga baltica]|uniref:hypothetical protein n=1 Tax=Cellulophaga baltica TaxID=76594 RepID=UPI002147B1D4|nr:hypothetical protein [Cellulophaga baltica]MCR1025762.1 hypothetical protein [Cellulophaga baltica]